MTDATDIPWPFALALALPAFSVLLFIMLQLFKSPGPTITFEEVDPDDPNPPRV